MSFLEEDGATDDKATITRGRGSEHEKAFLYGPSTEMPASLPCDLNDLVREHVEGGTNDLVEIASMMAESVADLVLLAPEEDHANLLAHVISTVGR